MWAALVLSLFIYQPDSKLIQKRIQDALAALQQNDPAAAERQLLPVTAAQPQSAPVWFLLAQAQARQNKMPLALASADKAARFAGKDPSLLYNLALFNLEAGRPAQAVAIGQKGLSIENSAEMHDVLGRAYQTQKDWPHAIEHLAEVRKRNPYSEEAIFRLGQAQMESQDFPAAIRTLEDGRKVFDKSPQLELALGVAYYGQRRFSDAVDRFLRVMQLAPDIPQPYYFIGRILEHAAGRIPEVLQHAAAFEQSHPTSPLGFVLHARALLLLPGSENPQADADRAELLLKKALIIKDDQADAHLLLGMVFERRRKFQAAASEFERAISLSPNDPAPHFRLARAYDRLGRHEDAAKQRALHEKLSAESGSALPPQ